MLGVVGAAVAARAASLRVGAAHPVAPTAAAAATAPVHLELLVTADTSACLPGMVAAASACDVDKASGRPILGVINICPAALGSLGSLTAAAARTGATAAEQEAVGRLVEALVHECVHVLVSA
jgi:hypothetical protein